jgi:predicted DNA-binding transcriptional regulator
MENSGRVLTLLQQNRKGIPINTIAKRLRIDRSTVYRHLESLYLRGKVTYKDGIAYPTIEETEPPWVAEAVKYFQWRATPKGGDNRFFRAMFGKPEPRRDQAG